MSNFNTCPKTFQSSKPQFPNCKFSNIQFPSILTRRRFLKSPYGAQVPFTCSSIVLFSVSTGATLPFPCCGMIYKACELAPEDPAKVPGEGSKTTSGLFKFISHFSQTRPRQEILTQPHSPTPHKPRSIHSPAPPHHHKAYLCTATTASVSPTSYPTSSATRAFSLRCEAAFRGRLSWCCMRGVGRMGCVLAGRGRRYSGACSASCGYRRRG